MKEKLTARLFGLQRKLNYISIYNHENGSTLFKYSIEFESLLNILLKINYQEFYGIYNGYNVGTRRYCELGCEFNDEDNRQEAFSAGIYEMDLYIKECLRILAA